MVGSEEESDGDAVSAHSPEPWTYDEDAYEIRDARGYVAVEFRPGAPRTHENGHRIAALAQENARLREALTWIQDLLAFHEGTAKVQNPENVGECPTVYLNGDDLDEMLLKARTALRAGGDL